MSEEKLEKLEQLRLLCRVCVRHPGVLSVFADATLVMWLACTDMRIYRNDGLPDSLCRNCHSSLQQAFSFRKKCIKSDEELRSLIFNDLQFQPALKMEEEFESVQKMEMPSIEQVVVKTDVELNSDSETVPQEADSPWNLSNWNFEDNCEKMEQSDGFVSGGIELNSESERVPMKVDNASNLSDLNFDDNCEKIEKSSGFVPDDEDFEFRNVKMAAPKDNEDCPSEVKLCCQFCKQEITGHKEYREHVQQHKHETYKCDECQKVYWGLEHIERHKKLHLASKSTHFTNELPCQFCGLMFNMLNLRVHIKEQHASEQRPYVKCYICNQVLHSSSIRAHLQRHENLKLPCTICGKTFRTKISLRDHEKTHSKAKPYICFYCGKKFKTHRGRNVHTREIHAVVKAYKCPQCEKSFKNPRDLTRHLKTHGNSPKDSTNIDVHKVLNKKHKYQETCEVCGKSFKRKSSLWTHLKTHSEEKPYPCSYCGKRFVFSQGLIVHERTHTGAKPYGCPLCDAAYRQQSGVVQHFKTTHRGFEYYEERRRKSGMESSNGNAEVVHTPKQQNRTVTCDACQASFATKLMLRKHMKAHPK